MTPVHEALLHRLQHEAEKAWRAFVAAANARPADDRKTRKAWEAVEEAAARFVEARRDVDEREDAARMEPAPEPLARRA